MLAHLVLGDGRPHLVAGVHRDPVDRDDAVPGLQATVRR